MSRIDIRLLYQKKTGYGLEHLRSILDNPSVLITAECPECSEEFQEGGFLNDKVVDYMKWLEEELEAALSVGEQLFNIVLQNEESE